MIIIMKKIVLFILLMLPLTASAQWNPNYNEIGGLWYYLDKITNEATVVQQPGMLWNLNTPATVNIPATVEYEGVSYPVTKIERNAFFGNTKIMNFTIPNSVRFIGQYAFHNTGWYYSQPDETCLYLDDWFLDTPRKYYTNQRSLNISEGTRGIAERALGNFSFITSITMPNSLIYINDYAFEDCKSLTSIDIPNGVTEIGYSAFSGLDSIKAIDIPISVTKIGFGAFSGCESVEKIRVADDNENYDSRDNCNAIIEKSTNKLVSGCKNTVIPNSVTKIGENAFSGCRSLTSIVVPNSVTKILEYAFSGCINLNSAIVGNGVTEIGGSAFAGCHYLHHFYCYAETPPSLLTDWTGRNKAFEDYSWSSHYVLHVLKGSLNKYSNSAWKKFFGSIVPLTASDPTSGIEESPTVKHQRDHIYTLSGQRVTNPKPGIYIQGGRKIVIK